jgi:hypothetical protein
MELYLHCLILRVCTSDRHIEGEGTHKESVQQATEADWLTRASDYKCAEPSKFSRLLMCGHFADSFTLPHKEQLGSAGN